MSDDVIKKVKATIATHHKTCKRNRGFRSIGESLLGTSHNQNKQTVRHTAKANAAIS